MFSFILELGLKKKQVFVNFGFAVLRVGLGPIFLRWEMFSPPMHVSVFTAGLHDLSGGRARWAFSRQAKAGFLGNLNIFDICNILISCLVYAS